MGLTTGVKNGKQMEPQRQKPKFSVAITTEGYKKLINNTLGDPKRSQRFVTAITSAVAVNQQLQECEAGSILAAALLGETLNLSPSPQLRQYYLVPFNNKKTGDVKATFVLGYVGYIQLAIRSGYYKDINAIEIREGEYLGKDPDTGKPRFKFIEDDDERENLPVIGYMASYEYINGFTKTLYWSKKKMIKHADKYSPAFSMNATSGQYPKVSFEDYQAGKYNKKDEWLYSSFWYKDFDGMALKTMLRQLISKWGVMSIEMQNVYEKDNSVLRFDGDNIVTDQSEEDIIVDEPTTPNIPNVDLTQPEFTDVVNQVSLEDLK